jgi:UDP-N-acetylglucosamine 4-epimerase
MKILITGGAGFIGSNLCEYFLENDYEVVCLDNFSTGYISNILPFFHKYPNSFKLIFGDIRNIFDCNKAVEGVDYVLHEAALGSVPRSIKDPRNSNDVNITGFLNMLMAAKDEKVRRFIYASSSSVYGDDRTLPKEEGRIGRQLSPYAVTKYVNELYADIFAEVYGIECIGLRYFNVFGKRQSPEGSYAAVIPLFIKKLLLHESPIINGDGSYSRDFTYIKNVVQMNLLAIKTADIDALNTVYNVAYGQQTTLNELVDYLKNYLSKYDPEILSVESIYGQNRPGDIPHSLANIEKAKCLLHYNPRYDIKEGLKESIQWYWENLNDNK